MVELQHCAVECLTDVAPSYRANEPLIAIGQLLSPNPRAQAFHARNVHFKIGLVEVQLVCAAIQRAYCLQVALFAELPRVLNLDKRGDVLAWPGGNSKSRPKEVEEIGVPRFCEPFVVVFGAVPDLAIHGDDLRVYMTPDEEKEEGE